MQCTAGSIIVKIVGKNIIFLPPPNNKTVGQERAINKWAK
jgi:hypothetical protein